MKLNSRDQEAIHSALQRIYALTDLDGFTAASVQTLGELVTADISAFNEVNYPARRMLTVISDPEAQRFYQAHQLEFESLMHQNPLIEHYARKHDAPRKISDHMRLSDWKKTDIYEKIYSRFSGAFQMAMVLPLDSTAIVAYAFNRAQSDFTERHRALLTALQPHVTQAYRNALIHTQSVERTRTREEMLDSMEVGWVDLDHDLRVLGLSSQTRSMLEAFFTVDTLDANRLPPQLNDWLAGRLADANPEAPAAPLVVENEAGRLIIRLFVSQASRLPSLLIDCSVGEDSPAVLSALGVTDRQAEILYWLAKGKSNAEIAIILNISVRTVETHVYRLLEQLGVNNRTEAANIAMRHLMSDRPGRPVP